ncbi:phosphogluconate dehydrogenase (NAD(+)-dependent, decarboxylating) [Weissella confusa]|uniref:phosphogluconate dehydrogenase (NAD(+)-dependent, decarboxylating) n=1 Tax=Weissella confusa TaxID=1583 RepID=UPI000989A3A1|nr:decarboxylating 6-phosphogluconate dehydrogenase [Weissella confusa]MBJ7648909.1 decarboxylating 6-phosphogluconate dehydrogenase [Weissella confusa]MBJ7662005.1 decarboxylating 6-phosphogluconate dehydrogenase [Weissella confusa]MCT0013111.1 decarboxylating 6-phosphogluconate dehydrogenase [Weissella confusa]MCT2911833.1 decarboxylating 6-phosphogluconate dehydrogenase [Weissella confusa]MDA5457268.1 6-phosphogluconate dehydrogenase, decarboxylating [Weissella confusa]
MKFAMIGLGKMGLNLVKNAADNGHEVVAFDLNADSVKEADAYSDLVSGATDMDDMLAQLPSPKVVWVMVPAGVPTNSTIDTLIEKLEAGDIIIDGGNSNYKDNLEQNKRTTAAGIKFFDAGTSGGMSGARNGGNFMIGGDDAEAWKTIEPLFKSIALEDGYLYTGRLGSGHYLKMVHNGIEYGMMQAIAEGFEVLEASQYDYDYEAVAKLWNHGSVVRSWLMELAEEQFAKDPKLDAISGRMHSSGEGKWTIEESLDLEVPAPVIALSLMMRYRSLQEDTFTGKVVSALRNGFGGHAMDAAK